MSEPWLNVSRIVPLPSFASLTMSSSPLIWMSCWRRGFSTLSSISLAESSEDVACTVMYGMSTSGTNDTGSRRMLTMPRTTMTRVVIVTVIGLSIRCFSIAYLFTSTSELSARLRLPETITWSPSFSSAFLSLLASTT